MYHIGLENMCDFTKLEFSNAMNGLNRNLELILKNKPSKSISNSKPERIVTSNELRAQNETLRKL